MDPMNNPTPTPNPSATPVPPVPPAPEPNQGTGQVPNLDPSLVASESEAGAGGVAIGGAAGASAAGYTQQPDSARVAATDPIMMPEPAPAPDPVEEELKAPMKAAEPVPGSIGSAVSMPAGENGGSNSAAAGNNPFAAPQAQTPNVSFNDPATQPDGNNPAAGQAMPVKKKTNKTTLIVLVVVAAMVVIALVVVLVMMLMGNNNSSNNATSNNSSSGNNNVVTPTEEDEEEEEEGGAVATGNQTLVCTSEIQADTTDTTNTVNTTTGSQKVTLTAEFSNGLLNYVATETVTVDEAGNENTESSKMATTTQVNQFINSSEALNTEKLEVDEDGNTVVTLEDFQNAYEGIDYICEVL